MRKRGTGKISKKCKHCNLEFLARHDRVGLFCSRSCASSCKPKQYFRVNKNCEICSKEFTIKRYRQKSALFCSVECRRAKMPKGESHHFWKGGVARSWSSRQLIKSLIIERGKCEECFSAINLQGHHVIAYSKNKMLQCDVNNIKVLCIRCHARKHPLIENFILKGINNE